MIVKNTDEFSKGFKTTLGVRQGGKTSPKIFSIYTEELLEEISKSDIGITLKNNNIDIIAYADDIIILSTTKAQIQKALDIVTKIGDRFEIKFNPEKTIYMTFNRTVQRAACERRNDTWQDELTLDGERIKMVSSFKYLGFELNEKNNDKGHIKSRKKATMVALSKLKNIELLSDETNPFLKGHLFKTFVMPVLFYGSVSK